MLLLLLLFSDLLTSVLNVFCLFVLFSLASFITCFWCPVFSSSTIIYPQDIFFIFILSPFLSMRCSVLSTFKFPQLFSPHVLGIHSTVQTFILNHVCVRVFSVFFTSFSLFVPVSQCDFDLSPSLSCLPFASVKIYNDLFYQRS